MKDEMHILREVSTTAAAHGSMALSEIMGKKIKLFLPSVQVLSLPHIVEKVGMEGMVITTQSQLLSGIHGRIMFVLGEKNAFKLVDMCYQRKDTTKKIGLFTQMGMSVIKEVNNIIIFSYINSLSFFIKKPIIPSFPMFINAPFTDIIHTIKNTEKNKDTTVLVEACFEEEHEKIGGNFWLILSYEAAEEIKNICKNMLERVETPFTQDETT